MMAPDALRASCALLWGPRWQSEAAAALGVNRSQLWRWTTGRYPIPAPEAARLRERLAAIVRARITELSALGLD